MRAIGLSPSARAFSALATRTAAAPSEICEELPAVTVPFLRKTGFSAASFSIEVSGRGPSSFACVTFAPLFCGASIGTISSAKRPLSGRHYLLGEAPAPGRGARAPVAFERGGILVLAADVVLLGDVLRRLAVADERIKLAQPRIGEAPADRSEEH